MREFTLCEAASALNGVLSAPGDTRITRVVIDSREAGPGALFIPIRGDRFDGHAFIPAAMENGAACCLTSQALNAQIPHILVPDTGKAFLSLAGFYRALFPVKVVGITGSVGKTTTKECVASALGAKFNVLKNQGNLNNQTGVPLTLFRLEEGHQAAVIEMGTNHFGEIESLSAAARPDICLFTNIGEAHIEHFGSREGILKGKSEMLSHMAPGGLVLLNGDDELLLRLKTKHPGALCFGLGPHCNYRAVDIIDEGLAGMAFTVRDPGGEETALCIPAPGMHMVYNALAAFAVGRAFGMAAADIRAGLMAYEPVGGRMRIDRRGGITVINDTYNASPAAMKAALNVLTKAKGRTVCILGDMLELGERAMEYHREVGAYAAHSHVSLILCAGPLARGIYEGALGGGAAEARYFSTREELQLRLGSLVRPGDTILVKASHSMGFGQIAEGLLTASVNA